MVKKESAGLSAMFLRISILFLLLMPFSAVNVYADTIVDTVPVGNGPMAVAVNPVTKKVYVANWNGNGAPGTVTIIKGANNYSTTTIPVGAGPRNIAVNTVTNKIYVTSEPDSTVTVINGATDSVITTLVDVWQAFGIVVNPVTNKIYVTQWNGIQGNMTVINGANDQIITTIPLGPDWAPLYIAVDSVHNKIYVSTWDSNSVTVINGANDQIITTVPVGTHPQDIAVNPVTNKIYVPSGPDSTVTVIDGNTYSTQTLSPVPYSNNYTGITIAVNTVTNKIYVGGGGQVTVIDGAINSTPASISTTVPVGTTVNSVAVNPSTNKIYAGGLTVIDAGNNNSITTVSIPPYFPGAIGVDSVHNMIYVADGGISFNNSPGNVIVISGSGQYIPVGAPVSVSVPVSNPSGGNITVTFEDVITGGNLTVVETQCPAGNTGITFISPCYEIHFDGQIAPGTQIYLTIPYDYLNLGGGINESELKIYHDGAACTTGNSACSFFLQNTSSIPHSITVKVTSLSPFWVGYYSGGGPYTGANTNMIVLLALLAVSTGVFLIRKIRTQTI